MNKDEPETALEFLKKVDETLKRMQSRSNMQSQNSNSRERLSRKNNNRGDNNINITTVANNNED